MRTTAELRDALAHPPLGGVVSLVLAEGVAFNLSGAELRVHGVDVTLRGDGAGAVLDAQGLSRHFDVALGGALHLERLRLVGGGMETVGGAALVRWGGALSAVDVRIEDSEASEQGGDRCGQL